VGVFVPLLFSKTVVIFWAVTKFESRVEINTTKIFFMPID